MPKPSTPKKELRAIGVSCGIGSMLVGARQAGFRVVGNIEDRTYCLLKDSKGQNTFQDNFSGALFRKSIQDLTQKELQEIAGCDLLLGQPTCGNFSCLGTTRTNTDNLKDIPAFIETVVKLRPRFFAMENLPGSLKMFGMETYANKLPEYDLFPEFVSNWNYGNIQKGRKRFLLIGALRSERFVFTPGERPNPIPLWKIIAGIEGLPNHLPHTKTMVCHRASCRGEPGRRWSWGEVSERFLEEIRPGKSWTYVNASGGVGHRVGFLRTYWDKHCHCLIGYNAIIHPKTGLPMSIRERARIQGFPDDFVFYGMVVEPDGTWEHFRNVELIRQTGKAIPVQFCQYLARQVAAKIKHESFDCSGVRLVPPNRLIDEAKQWYCQNVGYSNKEGACESCWLKKKCGACCA